MKPHLRDLVFLECMCGSCGFNGHGAVCVARKLADELFRAADGFEQLDRNRTAHKLLKIRRTLQLPFESCRADLKIIAVRHGILFVENRIYRAGNRLAVRDIHAAVLVDVQTQEPFSALADIFHVPELAADLFDSPESLIRLDMSEFMEKFSVSRIIGSPPGYVGYDEAGQLTEKIRRKPYSVVLFDEIEKAHPDVLNILLQILDDGRITDAQGRPVDFENTVIVMTTNAGSNRKGGAMGFGGTVNDMGRERALKALGEFLRPEFINRVDEIVYFNSLTEENFRSIAKLMLEETRDAIAERGISMTWNTALIDYLVRKSYSVTYGARNLRRTIQKDVEDAIAQKIIDCRGENAGHISVSADDNGVVVEVGE